jgi:flagellar protein FliS
MRPANHHQAYRRTSTLTAPPGRIVLMLYDGALRYLEAALVGLTLNDPAESNATVNTNLQKAQGIIRELNQVLDLDQGGELAGTLSRLYYYFDRRIQSSNLTKTRPGIDEVIGHLTELRNSWHQMLHNRENPTGVPATSSLTSRVLHPA